MKKLLILGALTLLGHPSAYSASMHESASRDISSEGMQAGSEPQATPPPPPTSTPLKRKEILMLKIIFFSAVVLCSHSAAYALQINQNGEVGSISTEGMQAGAERQAEPPQSTTTTKASP